MKKLKDNSVSDDLVSAAEAADILRVRLYAISRIDREGLIIERYKVGHRTHVYGRRSLDRFLSSRLIKPKSLLTIDATAELSSAARKIRKSDTQTFTLKDLLPQKGKKVAGKRRPRGK
ncbi:MAG TPA: hypothetical protein VJU59_23970 [Paraburkholderia sp.]|uniref:hypothetical protein n=1 Tax=Paraburkholderia sp. TaxID=1926495 RepID=UPI002B462D60|nr:hypothetical protein [Paraburkholderia sp.]HKR42694.1 hypothetical protein [Paraburkholderia sp.]